MSLSLLSLDYEVHVEVRLGKLAKNNVLRFRKRLSLFFGKQDAM